MAMMVTALRRLSAIIAIGIGMVMGGAYRLLDLHGAMRLRRFRDIRVAPEHSDDQEKTRQQGHGAPISHPPRFA